MSTTRIPRRLACLVVLLAPLASMPAHAADLTVSAAASLTDAFRDIGRAYEQQYPGTKVRFNFAASGPLLQQIAQGAPVDVFASADEQTMNQAAQQQLIDPATRHDFARNTLVLIVPSDSTLPIHSVADLTRPDVVRVAVGNPTSVPVGRYSMQVLGKLPQWPAIQPKVIHTQNVRQSLDYVARGEVQAGFVYGTDAAIMPGKVRVASVVPTPEPVRYPIAVVKASAQPDEARRFESFVRTPAAQAILARYGFEKAR